MATVNPLRGCGAAGRDLIRRLHLRLFTVGPCRGRAPAKIAPLITERSQRTQGVAHGEAVSISPFAEPEFRLLSEPATTNRRKGRERSLMQGLFSNLRYAVRQFRQSPVFAVAAVLTLALGIGGTTAIFTLIHAVMLRSLPVSDPGRLYRVG